jgi:hypothetical protein
MEMVPGAEEKEAPAVREVAATGRSPETAWTTASAGGHRREDVPKRKGGEG